MKNLHRKDIQQLILMIGSGIIFSSALLIRAFLFMDDFTKYALLFIIIAGPLTLHALILLYNRFKWKFIGIILFHMLIMFGYFKGISELFSSQHSGDTNPESVIDVFLMFGAVVIHFLVFVYFVWFFKRKKRKAKEVKEDLTEFPLTKAVIPKGTSFVFIILYFLFTLFMILKFN